tara:strand:- start:1654 stop:2385 length:732 start_codon:yes stop_codon:yes gene_type:complete
MKGIILAGGSGSRLYPSTLTTNKHLLPIYDKPMIYYSLDILVKNNVKDICLITSPEYIADFEKLKKVLENVVSLTVIEQDKPNGIAESFLLSEKLIRNNKVMLVLGDTFLNGHLPKPADSGATIYAKKVNDPTQYGIVEFNEDKALSIEEKPTNPKSKYAVPGVYFYDENVVDYAKQITPSPRGELEITDINKIYLKNNSLNVVKLKDDVIWLDAGTHDSLLECSNYVKEHQTSTKRKIGLIV